MHTNLCILKPVHCTHETCAGFLKFACQLYRYTWRHGRIIDAGNSSDLKEGLELGGLRGVPHLAQPLWQGVPELRHKPAECRLWCAVQTSLLTPQQHALLA